MVTPNQGDLETAPERDLVSESTVTSFQEPRAKFNFFGGSFLFFSSEIMPDRCVVVGCSNIPDAEKGITLHKIPFVATIEVKQRPEGRNGRTL